MVWTSEMVSLYWEAGQYICTKSSSYQKAATSETSNAIPLDGSVRTFLGRVRRGEKPIPQSERHLYTTSWTGWGKCYAFSSCWWMVCLNPFCWSCHRISDSIRSQLLQPSNIECRWETLQESSRPPAPGWSSKGSIHVDWTDAMLSAPPSYRQLWLDSLVPVVEASLIIHSF